MEETNQKESTNIAPKNLLKGLKRPKAVEFHHMEAKPEYGKFIAEPFEKGSVAFGLNLNRT